MPTERILIVDRIEQEVAVLVDEHNTEITVPIGRLRASVHEGAVLRVPCNDQGALRWEAMRVEGQDESRRRSEAEKLLSELWRRDPGGDVRT